MKTEGSWPAPSVAPLARVRSFPASPSQSPEEADGNGERSQQNLSEASR